MYIFFAVLILIAAILLIGVVLIQKSKGGGLASNYAGANQMMGYRKTTDIIEKLTWGLAIFICVLSIAASFTVGTTAKSSIKQHQTQQTTGTAAPASQQAPAQPAAPAK